MKTRTLAIRKAVALMICFALILPLCSSVLAMSLNEEEITLWGHRYSAYEVNRREVEDAEGNQFELYEIGDYAYYIYDPVAEKFLEGSPCAPSPYLGLTDDLVYIGPMNYYQRVESGYKHTVQNTDTVVEQMTIENLQREFDRMLMSVRDEVAISDNLEPDAELNGAYDNMIEDDNSDEGYIDYYVSGYSNIRYATYPANEGNTCGYVAATLLLYYWHKRNGGVIPSSYLTSTGKLKTDGTTTSNNLQKKLISFGDGGSSWALEIRDVLVDYCNWRGIKATSTYYLTGIGYRDELRNNRPAILFGRFPNVSSSGSISHAVTAYGFHVNLQNNTTSVIVHYGWSGYSEVYLDTGLIGSVTLFNPQ